MTKASIILTIVSIYTAVSLFVSHQTGQDLLYNATQQAIPQVPNVNAITFVSFINGGFVIFAKMFVFQVPNVPAVINILWYLLAIVLFTVILDYVIDIGKLVADILPW